jgi:actin cytoskeleton-regulatory complex protein PAN1
MMCREKERRVPGEVKASPSSRPSNGISTPSRQDDASTPSTASRPSNASYSTFKSAEDRAAFIKQQAEQRMAERWAALGLKPPARSNQPASTQRSHETDDRGDRLRQAEAEDAKRDRERQRRLAEEQSTPPPVTKSQTKPPPPPPSRKVRGDSVSSAARSRAAAGSGTGVSRQQAELEETEKAVKQQQRAQEAETKRLQ